MRFVYMLMTDVILIFPHQLFTEHPALAKAPVVFIVEEFLFFRQYKFHKQKLALHRASMKYYASYLQEKGLTVKYIEANDIVADVRQLIDHLAKAGTANLHLCDVTDNWLQKRIIKGCIKNNIRLIQYTSPGFLNSNEDIEQFSAGRTAYFQTAFYIQQRKKRKILLTPQGNPAGGQWTFDKDNRKKYPVSKKTPVIHFPAANSFIEEAIKYVEVNFAGNPGKPAPLIYPINSDDAAKWLEDFLTQRFSEFGIYEDAIVKEEYFLHHSVLSPALNTGLITPQQVTDRVLAFAAAAGTPVNSTEGFIRQVTGWREFVRIVYMREGSKQRTMNYWGFKRKLPHSFWQGTTGIEPVDHTISKILAKGYCHHIERLMILGNFMLLCEIDPDDVYRWFMEMFVDSYDWVMVPNVYGMTQFADGGLMTTKPYISGSNYILKMSNYKKGEWCEIWDALFWRFMYAHRDFFVQNPRLGMLVKTLDNMPAEKRDRLIRKAENYLKSL